MEYEEIVSNLNAPTLVLAGPGAGKTYLLSDRVKRLIDQDVDSNHISVVTFGRDASQHMRNKLLDTNSGFSIPFNKMPHISTLNSLGMEIVNCKPKSVGLRKTALNVQSDEAVKRLIFRDSAMIIGKSEDEARSAFQCKAEGDCNIGSKPGQCEICQTYWNIMSACNYIDFDDQVIFANQILENEDDILAEYKTRATYLLVDEYQDINAAQFRLIKTISANSINGLFVVGDDAQSIYGFRGADPSYILNFADHFKDSITPPLAHSRRCPKQIIDPASMMLKAYYPEWLGPFDLEYHVDDVAPPTVLQLPSETKEAHLTARVARKAISVNNTVLVLAPKKDFFPLISKVLRRYGVPHTCPTSLLPEHLNKRLDVIRNILKWVQNPNDSFLTRVAVEELLNHGTAKVPGFNKGKRLSEETLMKRLLVETEIAHLWSEVNTRDDFFSALLKHEDGSENLNILKSTMTELLELFTSESGNNLEFISKFCAASGVWKNSNILISDIDNIISALVPASPTGFGSVQLMTMRKAKGLEADVVVIVGLEDDIIPGNKADVKEEARLLYVSMTRAKKRLYLFHAFKRPRSISFGQDILNKNRSRFLDAVGIDSIYYREQADTA
ncbi:MAG: ATP-dependent helicase [Candidatus Neomarinimicrobiota bacterium]